MTMRCAFLAACAILLAAPLQAQTPADSGAFVARLGSDTTSLERYVLHVDRLEAEVISRVPSVTVSRLAIRWKPDGLLTGVEVVSRPPDAPAGAPPTRRTRITFGGDSATVETTQDGESRTRRIAGRADMVPLVGGFYSPYELLLARARGTGRASVDLTVLGGDVYTVRREGPGAVTIVDETFGERSVRVGPDGRLLSFQAVGSPQGTIVERVAWFDLDAVARSLAGRGLGPLSPRDTVRAAFAGANLLVDYSRPSKRGRLVFGGLVPWNEVWRTGANRATHFQTDRDLVIGGATVPAGTYTLFTLPSPSGWKLIINRQTDQGGLSYDASQDLARVDLRVEETSPPVETFTIALEETAGGGVLKLAWDRTVASVPFQVP